MTQMAAMAAALVVMAMMPTGRVQGNPFIGVSCVVVNLEYTDCTWNQIRSPEANYTFQSRLGSNGSYSNCPRYLLKEGERVGCRLSYRLLDKFRTLHVRLSHDNVTQREWAVSLLQLVKLNPPRNLSVEINAQNQELWLYWNHSMKENCRENQVTYRKSSESAWQFSTHFPANYYSLPQVSLKSQYELKVRTRVSNSCGESKFWSDWSSPVFCCPAEQRSVTARSPNPQPLVFLLGAALLWHRWLISPTDSTLITF
ncbi:cytokine receptor common subunit gamma-like [Scleropages formosus]|uniref:Cytokine receptor common subunit gamma-like n=1 Tax=Scleropages formosus TaxID=113540 RepID=A0A8C9RG82_SCLFO|nr:cytokine receptor common subunit gamma-like [Scleropages formosus]